MSLMDRFKSKKLVSIGYTKADMEELLKMELSDFDFVQIRTAWNEEIDKMDLTQVDNMIEEWFCETFSMKLARKKKP